MNQILRQVLAKHQKLQKQYEDKCRESQLKDKKIHDFISQYNANIQNFKQSLRNQYTEKFQNLKKQVKEMYHQKINQYKQSHKDQLEKLQNPRVFLKSELDQELLQLEHKQKLKQLLNQNMQIKKKCVDLLIYMIQLINPAEFAE